MDWPAIKKRSQHIVSNKFSEKKEIKQLKFVDFWLLIMLMPIICMNSHDMMSSLMEYIWKILNPEWKGPELKKIPNQQYGILRLTV